MSQFHLEIPETADLPSTICTPEVAAEAPATPVRSDASIEQHVRSIRRLSAWLLPGRWIRRIARGDLSKISSADVARLMKMACRTNPRTSRADLTAALLLGIAPLTEEQYQQVVIAYCNWLPRVVVVGGRSVFRLVGAAVALGIVLIGSLELFGDIGISTPYGYWGLILVCAIAGMLPALPVSVLYEAYRWNRARETFARTLGRLKAPEGVAALLSGTLSPVPRTRQVCEEGLATLLRSIDLRTVAALPQSSRLACFRLLNRPDESLVLSLLDLLEQCGDGDACQPVASLAQRTTSEAVRVRAEAILPILAERLARARSSTVLLRPSSVDASTDTLLRAGQVATEAPSELLRATEEEPQCRMRPQRSRSDIG